MSFFTESLVEQATLDGFRSLRDSVENRPRMVIGEHGRDVPKKRPFSPANDGDRLLANRVFELDNDSKGRSPHRHPVASPRSWVSDCPAAPAHPLAARGFSESAAGKRIFR